MTQAEREQAVADWKQAAKDRGLPGTIARIGSHTCSPERVYCWAYDPSSPSGKQLVGHSFKVRDWYAPE